MSTPPIDETRAAAGQPWPLSRPAAAILLTAAISFLGLWILREFLDALAWAAIIGIASWPLFTRFLRLLPRGRRAIAPLICTLLVAILFLAPLIFVAVAIGHEAVVLVRLVQEAQTHGLPQPPWLAQIPVLGSYAGEWWQANLSHAGDARQWLGHLHEQVPVEWTPRVGAQIVHRITTLGFTLLTLFFLYRDGAALTRQLETLAERGFGPIGTRIGAHMIATVRGTVNGLVLVGLGEGILLGIAYAVLGLPHAVLIGAITGIVAMIPFGLPLIVGAAALVLLAQSTLWAAAGLFGFGLIVAFIADHFIRPVLIGGATRLPFLWVLLGILGGLESFGLLGLFLGPAVMAALVALWREAVAAR